MHTIRWARRGDMHWLPPKVATEIAEVMNSSRLSNAARTCLRTNLEIIKCAHYNTIGTTDKTYNEPYMHTHNYAACCRYKISPLQWWYYTYMHTLFSVSGWSWKDSSSATTARLSSTGHTRSILVMQHLSANINCLFITSAIIYTEAHVCMHVVRRDLMISADSIL